MLWQRYIKLHGKDLLYQNTKALYEAIEKRDTEEALHLFRASINQTISGGVSIYYE